ncbi:UDP-glucose dehydrogenase family protein [Mesorhizobium sp. UC74_2]|jgi:UDPglucose 6-dehydrogenase|uniref:UDP-glucose dehydrogenase family protein n=1 Tax=Mesorhizobium sp. UC74_2 TaxID=3350171 RepID=UPI003672DD65
MKVTIFGTGYVGLVTGACLAEVGHSVLCMDVDQGKIEGLAHGKLPIWEPGLEDIVRRNLENGNLSFTTDTAAAARHGEIQFIAVGTPPASDGAANLSHIFAVAEGIAAHMDGYRAIVTKSTVPAGTARRVAGRVQSVLDARHRETTIGPLQFDIVSNPEFLKEGAAIADFLKPDRIIVGTNSKRAGALMRTLYEPFNRNHNRMIFMDVVSAELTKYAANIMLATKISVMNELANIAELVGADIEQVRTGIGSDPRIGYHFIYAGAGYGGSCFPKDVRALEHRARELGYDAELLRAIENVNNRQKSRIFQKLAQYFGGLDKLRGKTLAVWGLAFKPNTDDMREAPSRTLMEALWEAGANVQAFDPVAMEEAQRLYGIRPDLVLCDEKYDTLIDADALIICTEWPQFRAPDFEKIGRLLKNKVIFDGRNLYSPAILGASGWKYYGIGRAANIDSPDSG